MRFNVPGSISVLNAVKTFERVKLAANDQQQAANQPTAKTIPAPSQPVNPATTQQPLQQPVKQPVQQSAPQPAAQVTTPAPAQSAPPQQQQSPQPQAQPQQQAAEPQQQAVTTPPPLPGSGLEFAGQIPTTGDRATYQELYDFYMSNQGKQQEGSPDMLRGAWNWVTRNLGLSSDDSKKPDEQKFRVETATGSDTQQITAPDQYLIAGIAMRKDGAYALDEYLRETDPEKKRQAFEKLPEDLRNSLIWVDDIKRNTNFNDAAELAKLVQDEKSMKNFRTLWEYGLVNAVTKAPDGSRLDPNNPEQYKQIVGNFSNIMSKALDDNLLNVSDLNLLYKNFVLDLGLDPDDPNSAAAFQSWRENTKKDPDNSFQTLALFFGIPLVVGGLASVLSGNFGFLPVLGLLFGGLGMFYGLGGTQAFGQTQAQTPPPEMYLGAPELGATPLYDVTKTIRNEDTGGMTYDTSDAPFMLPSSFYHHALGSPTKESPGRKFLNLTSQVGISNFETASNFINDANNTFTLKGSVQKRVKDITLNELIDHLRWRATTNANVPLSDDEKRLVAAVSQLALKNLAKKGNDPNFGSNVNQIYKMVTPLLEDSPDRSPEERQQALNEIINQLSQNQDIKGYLGFSLGFIRWGLS